MELQTKQLVMAIKQIAEEKNLPEESVHDVIQQAIAAAYRKDFGDREQDVRSTINFNTGDVTVYVSKEVVENGAQEDEFLEIELKAAKEFKPDVEVGETVEVLAYPKTFGRVAAQTAKQVILQKLREAEREIILDEYQDKIGEVLNGVVSRVESRVVRIDLGKATGILPMSEQIQGEYYSAGNRLKVFLKEVERTNRGPQLILSRANTEFIEYLFSNEVPEMENGAVEIKKIAREAGVRTKLAVSSSVPGVDPVGTFVGGHGTRVQAVMGEIGDREKIDIIAYTEDTVEFITSALSPTEVGKVELDEKSKRAVVRVAEDQLSVAIGKHGQNVRLASKLTGYEIDIEKLQGANSATESNETSADSDADTSDTASDKNDASDTKSEAEADSNKKEQTNEKGTPMPQKRFKRKSELEESLLSAIDQHGQDVDDTAAADDADDNDEPKNDDKTA